MNAFICRLAKLSPTAFGLAMGYWQTGDTTSVLALCDWCDEFAPEFHSHASALRMLLKETI